MEALYCLEVGLISRRSVLARRVNNIKAYLSVTVVSLLLRKRGVSHATFMS